eukprot:6213882-Pleurochrysis_carterae.AAC.1
MGGALARLRPPRKREAGKKRLPGKKRLQTRDAEASSHGVLWLLVLFPWRSSRIRPGRLRRNAPCV